MRGVVTYRFLQNKDTNRLRIQIEKWYGWRLVRAMNTSGCSPPIEFDSIILADEHMVEYVKSYSKNRWRRYGSPIRRHIEDY